MREEEKTLFSDVETREWFLENPTERCNKYIRKAERLASTINQVVAGELELPKELSRADMYRAYSKCQVFLANARNTLGDIEFRQERDIVKRQLESLSDLVQQFEPNVFESIFAKSKTETFEMSQESAQIVKKPNMGVREWLHHLAGAPIGEKKSTADEGGKTQ